MAARSCVGDSEETAQALRSNSLFPLVAMAAPQSVPRILDTSDASGRAVPLVGEFVHFVEVHHGGSSAKWFAMMVGTSLPQHFDGGTGLHPVICVQVSRERGTAVQDRT